MMQEFTREEWIKEAKKRFGDDSMKWKFICPSCGHIQTPQDFVDIGKDKNLVYEDCIGRYIKGVGCNWWAHGFLGTTGKGARIKNDLGYTEIFGFAEAIENGK